MTVGNINKLLYKLMGIKLTSKEKEALWESFKVKIHIEENPDSLDERQVSLQALMNAKK
jgi:hypothetical protein